MASSFGLAVDVGRKVPEKLGQNMPADALLEQPLAY
jgi:hypothetical protein